MTRGLFLFEIKDAFYEIGRKTVDLKSHEIEPLVKKLLEERAFDTYHSLLWREAEATAIEAFQDGYRNNGWAHR